MSPATVEVLRSLLAGERLLSLAVVAEGEPIAGLLPFVWTADGGALLVQASGLARHSRGLAPGAPFDAVVHAADDGSRDPLQVPRVTLQGRVRRLERDTPEFVAAARAFVERFPSAAQTLALSDFQLHRLEVETARLVAGFARAVDVTGQDLREAAAGGRT